MLKNALFQTTKIQNFETNSQLVSFCVFDLFNCFRPQRYKILKPIHNTFSPIDTHQKTVSDHKDTKFWNQFTTMGFEDAIEWLLFQTTKIQNFETNSQPKIPVTVSILYCFRPQRYKILKPIHNAANPCFVCLNTVSDHKDTKFWNQFTTL